MQEAYDVIVIGGGAAGLTASVVVGELGKRVALIERDKIGGDCTWTGCIPSKALLRIAKSVHHARQAQRYGITSAGMVDMAKVRHDLYQIIHEIYQHETPEAVSRRGVEVIIGQTKFLDTTTIEVNGKRLKAKKIVIATGGRAFIPPIDGLADVPYKSNADFFDNDRLPEHLLIMGAGPIGMEMGQAYARLGARVTIIGADIMPRDEPEVANVLRQIFSKEGINIVQAMVTKAQQEGDVTHLQLDNGDAISGDMLLVAVGRTPNIEGLGLEQAGINITPQGIPVNDYLQTNIPHIYAIGDVTTGAKFTHYAGFQGAIAGRNVLLPIKARGFVDELPWVTFTDPEVAHAGLTESQARQRYGDSVKVFHFPLDEGDRSVAENDVAGFIKLIYRGSGDLLGATVVAERAGEMILEFDLIIKKKIALRKMVGMIHAYPTYSDVAKKALSQLAIKALRDSKFAPLIKSIIKRLP